MDEFKFEFAVEGRSDDEFATETNAVPGVSLPEAACSVKSVGSHPKVSKTLDETPPPNASEVYLQPFHYQLAKSLRPSEYRVPGAETTLRYVGSKCLQDCMPASGSPEAIPTAADNSHSQTQSPIPASLQSELESLIQTAELQHSDLVPGVYEGGMKVWECAFDLVGYLTDSGVQFSGLGVLELGCGAGLPGILALLSGAKDVHFQDYNPEIINCITVPTVLLNTGKCRGNETGPVDSLASKCRFFSGDWNEFANLAAISGPECTPYDIILTSETIYSPSSQPKLLSCLKKLLHPVTGVVFLAAKSYYFGVGGSVQQFMELVASDGYFDVYTCRTFDGGIPRKILRLCPKRKG